VPHEADLPEPRSQDPRSSEAWDTARADIRDAVMVAFCKALHGTQLSPLAVIELVAEAVGSVYREVADAHQGDQPCTCGWQPSLLADIAALQAALAVTAAPTQGLDLLRVEVQGRA
jgi:hypothetical protein